MNGDLANQLTENCTSCLENVFSIKIKHKQNIDINKEDIFFAWLGNHDEPNWKITVCTLTSDDCATGFGVVIPGLRS